MRAADPDGPGKRPTTRPTGTWHCWADGALARTVGYGKDCLWFGGSGLLWRCDLRTSRMHVFTPMDGLPLEHDVLTQIAVASDGACVIAFSGQLPAYIHRPGAGWRELPPPEGSRTPGAVAFGPDDKLYCLQWNGPAQPLICRWDGERWNRLRTVPPCQAFVPLADGFLLGYFTVRQGSSSRSVVAYVGPEEGEPTVYELDEALHMDAPRRFFHAEGKTYVVFRTRQGGEAYRRVAGAKLVEDERAARLDPANASPIGTDARSMKLAEGLGPAGARGLLPPNHLADHSGVLDSRQFAYDANRAAWQRLNLDLAPVFRGRFDPATREAWWSTVADGSRVWQLVRLEANRPVSLRSIPEPQILGLFAFKDPAGRWWGAGKTASGRESFFAFRLDEKDDALRTYPCGRGIDGGYRPQVQLSPKGTVWLWTEKQSLRYEEANDAFVEAEPWDDFAFAFGPWRLSMAGPISSSGQAVCRLEDGTWRPLANPFESGQVRGNPSMIRGDRMLISTPHGVLEYDVTADRWALLHDFGGFRAAFTPSGQRVLVSRFCVLLYDGDPMVPVSREVAGELAAMNELLKLMDSDSWRVRDDATRKLKALYPRVADRLRAASNDPALSLEVRARIRSILPDDTSERPRMTSLFRSMHPLVARLEGTDGR